VHHGAEELALSLVTTDIAVRVGVSGACVTEWVGAASAAAPVMNSPRAMAAQNVCTTSVTIPSLNFTINRSTPLI
jgi:hypothetical protein